MTTHNAARLVDALSRYVQPDEPEAVKHILLIGARRKNEVLCEKIMEIYPAARLTIFDNNSNSLEKIRSALGVHAERLQIVDGKVSELTSILSQKYDLVIARHPDIIYGRTNWGIALRLCSNLLVQDGSLVVTTEELADAGFIHNILDSEGFAMVPGTPYTAIPVALTVLDRYILIYQRKV